MAEGTPLLDYSLPKEPGAAKTECNGAEMTQSLKPETVKSAGEVEGLSVGMTALFIIGGTIGVGSLVLPYGLSKTGWAGVPMLVLTIGACIYSGVLLGRSWVIVMDRYPEARHARNPFPLIGEKAIGTWMRILISVTNNSFLFGGCTVMLLLSAQNVQSLLTQTGVDFSYCYCVVVMAVVLVPLSWLRAPKDFKFIAVAAAVSMCSALVIVLSVCSVGIYREPSPRRQAQGLLSSVLLFGISISACGSTATFPTVQQEMKDPKKFSTSLLISGLVISIALLLVACIGYGAYGSDVHENVVLSLPRGIARTMAESLTIVHLLSAFIVFFNPIAQDFEDIKYFNVPTEFSWQRCLVRTWLVVCIAFAAVSLPNFSALMSLIGGSCVCLSCVVAPPVLYWRLCMVTGPWQPIALPTRAKAVCVCLVVFGVIGGALATYSSILALFSGNTFVPPCYVNITAASLAQNSAT